MAGSLMGTPVRGWTISALQRSEQQVCTSSLGLSACKDHQWSQELADKLCICAAAVFCWPALHLQSTDHMLKLTLHMATVCLLHSTNSQNREHLQHVIQGVLYHT